MRAFRFFLIFCFLFIFRLNAGVVSAQIVVLVDVDHILSKMGGYTSTIRELGTQITTYEQVIDSVQSTINIKNQKLEVERFLLTDKAIKNRENAIFALEQKKAKLKRTYFGADGFLVKSRKQLVQPYLDKVFSAIQDYAVENKIDIILDKKKQNNIIFASPALDRTKDIVSKMGLK